MARSVVLCRFAPWQLLMRIVLYEGIGRVSRAIRWITSSRFSHAAFLLDDDSVIEAWVPCVRHVSSLSEQHTPGTTVQIMEFAEPLSADENRALQYLAFGDLGIPYDFFGCVHFLTRQKEDKWDAGKIFCSRQVYSRTEKIGRPLLARTLDYQVAPGLIWRSQRLINTHAVITK
jgi:hypothetical protein